MSRHEAIATINAALAQADDETVEAVAELVQTIAGPRPLRPLSEREKSLLERSRQDFEAGRTYSLEESKALTDELFAEYRASLMKT